MAAWLKEHPTVEVVSRDQCGDLVIGGTPNCRPYLEYPESEQKCDMTMARN